MNWKKIWQRLWHTVRKIKFLAGIFVQIPENGWMEDEGITLWLKNVCNTLAKLEKSCSLGLEYVWTS